MPLFGDFQTEHIALPPDANAGGEPFFRFVHLSDLHLPAWRPRHERLVEAVNCCEPDFVFLTGDLITRRPESWKTLEALLAKMQARHGIFACRGNWELSFAPRPAVLRRMFAGWGARLLVNEARTLAPGGGTVRVMGLDDPGRGWPNFDDALAGPPADYNILLAHAPLAARFIAPRDGVDLVLSGHTHGGQARVPLLWRLMLPGCCGGFLDGLYPMEWGHVYVNRGFGGIGPGPVRFRCPAEVAVFEVRLAHERKEDATLPC